MSVPKRLVDYTDAELLDELARRQASTRSLTRALDKRRKLELTPSEMKLLEVEPAQVVDGKCPHCRKLKVLVDGICEDCYKHKLLLLR